MRTCCIHHHFYSINFICETTLIIIILSEKFITIMKQILFEQKKFFFFICYKPFKILNSFLKVINFNLGGTLIAPAFSGFAQYPPQPVLSGRGHPAAAFYPQPILYWGYPSPPVSPTAYFGPAPQPIPQHIATASPPLGPQNKPILVNF